jgi:hypothetical protein
VARPGVSAPEGGQDRSYAVLAFELAAAQRDMDRLRAEVKDLRAEAVRHDLWDVAQGSNRVDFGRLDAAIQEQERALEAAKVVANGQHDQLRGEINELRRQVVALERTIESNFRKGVILVFTSILAPLIVGGLVVIFQVLGRAP